jgi:hypothetical protein
VTPPKKAEELNPFKGSILLFDQSLSTQTAQLETSPQLSYVPSYQLWISFRPRYYFTEKLSLRVRADYYKDITNDEQTTLYREDVFGDVWTDLVYSTPVSEKLKDTKVSIGARALWPTSKASQANGTYVTLGASGGVSQTIPIKGEDAKALNSARVGVSLAYTHPFTNATTANAYGTFAYQRQNVDGFSFSSDQLRGGMLVNHQLFVILDTGLQITPKLGLTADMIWIDQWHYPPKDNVCVNVLGAGCTPVPPPNAPQFVQQGWFLTSLDYELFDELNLGIGYYNLANALGPDGKQRGLWGNDNIWWSPDARVFFDITANLDKIYDDVRSKKGETKAAAQRARVQQMSTQAQAAH